MYRSTAAIRVVLEKLSKILRDRDDKLLICSQSKLDAAHQILEKRWQIYNSIFWNQSDAATRYTVIAKLEGMTFDARTLIIDAGMALNQYVDLNIIPESSISL